MLNSQTFLSTIHKLVLFYDLKCILLITLITDKGTTALLVLFLVAPDSTISKLKVRSQTIAASVSWGWLITFSFSLGRIVFLVLVPFPSTPLCPVTVVTIHLSQNSYQMRRHRYMYMLYYTQKQADIVDIPSVYHLVISYAHTTSWERGRNLRMFCLHKVITA